MNPLARLLLKLAVGVHVRLYRATGGKLGATTRGLPVLLLTTRGRKSGVERTVPIVYVEDEGDPIVVGSMAGAPTHPAWFLNLRETPSVRVEKGAEKFDATAVVTDAEERERLWKRINAVAPFFEDEYQRKTERVIPVVRLRRAR